MSAPPGRAARAAASALLLLLLFLLAGCRGSATAFELEVGNCFSQPDATTAVEKVTLIDCDKPHDFEVFHLLKLEEQEFPGEQIVGDLSEDGCAAAFEGYVGSNYQRSDLYISYLFPTAATWAEGDREVVCLLRMESGQLSGSMRGSER